MLGWLQRLTPFMQENLQLGQIIVPFMEPVKHYTVVLSTPLPLILLIIPATILLMISPIWIPFGNWHCAFNVVKLDTMPTYAWLCSQTSWIGLSLQNGTLTSLSQSSPTSKFECFSMYMDGATTNLVQNMATTTAPSAVIPSRGQPPVLETDLSNILYKAVTPYVLAACIWALEHENITESYPNLVHNLSHGSPIGNPPPINYIFIPNNLPSANINPEYISCLIAEEVAAGWMDSLYSIEQAL